MQELCLDNWPNCLEVWNVDVLDKVKQQITVRSRILKMHGPGRREKKEDVVSPEDPAPYSLLPSQSRLGQEPA